MTGLADILDAFEKALVLEQELGRRAVECDRALLSPALVVKSPADLADCADRGARQGAAGGKSPADFADCADRGVRQGAAGGKSPADLADDADKKEAVKTPVVETPRVNLQNQEDPRNPRDLREIKKPEETVASPDFMFVEEAPAAGVSAAAVDAFLAKVVGAMGYALSDIARVRADADLAERVARVKPKCLVLLGRGPMQRCFPGRVTRRGVWYAFAGVPTVGTLPPAHILRFDSAGDPAGLRAAKLELWNTLKAALGRLGKTPPPVPAKK